MRPSQKHTVSVVITIVVSCFLLFSLKKQVFAQTLGVTPTLYCLSTGCNMTTPTLLPTTSTGPAPSVSSVEPIDALTSPIAASPEPCTTPSLSSSQSTYQTTNHSRKSDGRGGFLGNLFKLLLLLIDRILMLIGSGNTSLPCAPTNTSAPTDSPLPTDITSSIAPTLATSSATTQYRGFMTAPLGQLTPEMLSVMKNTWGANVIRLQMYPVDMAKAMNKPLSAAWPSILDTLDQTIAQANADGIKVIVDMHEAPFPNGVPGGDERAAGMWNSPELQPDFIDAWTRITQKLKARDAGIAGFDLFNEPEIAGQATAPAQWHPLAAKLAQTIHGIDPNIWIVYDPGPNGQAHGYINLTPLPADKVIYTIHDYGPPEFTSQCLPNWPCGTHYPYHDPDGSVYDKAERIKTMQPVVDFQNKYHVPILVGEFSVIRWAPKADAVQWLKDGIDIYESHGWSWTYHAFREYEGWSLEYDENPNSTAPVTYETDRAKVVKQAMQKNNQ
jgi:endoglucanase